MYIYQAQAKSNVIFRSFSLLIAFIVLCGFVVPPQYVYAQAASQSVLDLPAPGAMVPPAGGFTPCIIKGITIHSNNPLRFDFILDTGEEIFDDQEVRDCSRKLVKYFLAALTVSEKKMWVNLSPYENNRIISDELGKTEMGRDMLAQDYILKQLTSSMMYPEDNLGAEFWYKVYSKAQEHYGTTDIPLNTFNKIWIIPQKAEIFELGSRAFVVDSHLKVMLEEDFIALQNNLGKEKFDTQNMGMNEAEVLSGISAEVVREVLIPEIEREVNEGKNFAQLRQIYHSMILATWYKMRLKDSLLSRVYVNKGKTKGVENADKQINTKIYDQYLAAFQKGVYNYIKEDYDPATQQVIPRKYFSGGETFEDLAMLVTPENMLGQFSLTETPSLVNVLAPLSATQRNQIVNALDTDTNFEVTVDLAELGTKAQDLNSVVEAVVSAESVAQDDLAMMTMGVMSNNAQQLLASVRAQFDVTGRDAIFALNDIFTVVGLSPQQDRLDDYVRELETKNPKAAEIFPWIINNNLRKSYNASLNYVRSEIAARAALDDAAVRQLRNQLQDALDQIALSGLDLTEWNAIDQSFIRDDTASNLLRAEIMQGRGPFQAGERFRQDTEAAARRRQAILSEYNQRISQEATDWRANLENESNDSGQALINAFNALPGLQGLSTVEQYRIAKRVHRYIAQSVRRHSDDRAKSMQAIVDDSLYFGKLFIDQIATAEFGTEAASESLYRSLETIGRSVLTPQEQRQIDNLEPNRQSTNLKFYYLSQLYERYTTDQAMLLSKAETDRRMSEIAQKVEAAAQATIETRARMGLAPYSSRALNYFKSVFGQYLVSLDKELPQVEQAILDENFLGTATAAEQLGLEEVIDVVGWIENQDILAQEDELLAWARDNVIHVSNDMNAGKGTSVDRESMLPVWWGRTEVGAKATDTGWIQTEVVGRDAAGQEKTFRENISVAEYRLVNFLRMARDLYINQKEEVVSVDSVPWLDASLDDIYLFDRIDDRVAPENKRTYRQVIAELESEGVRFVDYNTPSSLQEAVPNILIDTNELVSEINGTNVVTPGGHGQIWTDKLLESLEREIDADKVTIRTIVNADGMSNVFSPVQLAYIARNKIPIAVMGSIRMPLDAKGGILGLRQMIDGSYALDILELAAAQESGKGEEFQAEGLTRGMLGKQLFNTNNVAANVSVLKPFLNDLRALLGDEAFYSLVTGNLMGNPKVKEGKDVLQMETVMVMAVLKLHQYLEVNRKTNPDIDQLMRKHGIDRLVNVIVVGSEQRTDHFTPVKFSWDLMLYFFSDHFRLNVNMEDQSLSFSNLREGHLPSYDMSKVYKVTENSFKALGRNVSMIGLDHLSMQGDLVEMENVVLRGNVAIENLSGETKNLNQLLAGMDQVQTSPDGRMILDNMTVLINQAGQTAVQFDAAMLTDQSVGTAVRIFSEEVQANALQINGALWRSLGQERMANFIREASGLTETELPQNQILAMTNPVQGASLEMISARTGISLADLLTFIQENMSYPAFRDSFTTLLSQELESAAVSDMVKNAWKVFAPVIAPDQLVVGDLTQGVQGSEFDLAMMTMEDIEVIKDFMAVNQELGVLMDFEGNVALWNALGLNKDLSISEAFTSFDEFSRVLEERKEDLAAIDGLGLYFTDVGRGVVVDKTSYIQPMIALHNMGEVQLSYELARAISGATKNVAIARVIDDIYAPSFDQAMLTFRDRQVLGQMFNGQKGQVITVPTAMEQQIVEQAQIENLTQTRWENLAAFTSNAQVQQGLVAGERIGIYFAGVGIGFLASTAALANLVNNVAQADQNLAFQLATTLADATNTQSYQAIFRQTSIAKLLKIENPYQLSETAKEAFRDILSGRAELELGGVSGIMGPIRRGVNGLRDMNVLVSDQTRDVIKPFSSAADAQSQPQIFQEDVREVSPDDIHVAWGLALDGLNEWATFSPEGLAQMLYAMYQSPTNRYAADTIIKGILEGLNVNFTTEELVNATLDVVGQNGLAEGREVFTEANLQEMSDNLAGRSVSISAENIEPFADNMVGLDRFTRTGRILSSVEAAAITVGQDEINVNFINSTTGLRNDIVVSTENFVRMLALGFQEQPDRTEALMREINQASTDAAALTTQPVGGIDLNPELLDLQIKRDGEGFPLPMEQQPLENMQIEGFLPVIINVTPVNSLPLLLGLSDDETGVFEAAKSAPQPADADTQPRPLDVSLLDNSWAEKPKQES